MVQNIIMAALVMGWMQQLYSRVMCLLGVNKMSLSGTCWNPATLDAVESSFIESHFRDHHDDGTAHPLSDWR